MVRSETRRQVRRVRTLAGALGDSHLLAGSVCGVALLLAHPWFAAASCDQIPGTANTFRGTLGNLSRPFVGPGDYFDVGLGSTCDSTSPGFASSAAEHVVTFVFQPPEGPRNIVVLAADCNSLLDETAACAAEAGVARVTCQSSTQGGVLGVELVERGGKRRLRVRFPDTDALVGGPNDGRTLTGPTAVAVSHAGDPLPCGLASATCEEQSNVVACVDHFFRIDGGCDHTTHEYIDSFVALPPPNDAQALCVEPTSLCTGRGGEMRFTVDAAGNVLLPMDWQGVLLPGSVPVARLLRATAAIQAFPGSSEPLRLPRSALLRSLSLEGGILPPVFEPHLDPSEAEHLVLFGSVDAPRTVLLIGRRPAAFRECRGGEADGRPCLEADECPAGSCGAATCTAGANDGQICGSDDSCPGGQCGSSLFDFSHALLDGIGPVVAPRFGAGVCQDSQAPCQTDAGCGASRCVSFKIVAEDPVPLEALIETPDLLVSVVPEAIDGRDLNGDGDAIDDVLLMTDRRTGRRQSVGAGGAPGLAATRIRDLPFNYPAVVAENDIVAVLEAEPHEGRGDLNGDGDEFDTLLRVFRGSGDVAEELTPAGEFTVDAAPLVDGRVMVLRDGLLWFRSAEASRAPQVIERVSVTASGGEAGGASRRPALSADGSQVAFESRAPNLHPVGGGFSAFVRDRRTNDTVALTLEHEDLPAAAPAMSPSLSGDGRFVAVETRDLDSQRQIFLLDRDADRNGVFDQPAGVETIPASIQDATPELLGDGRSAAPLLSADGRWLTYTSDATRLLLPLQLNPEGARTYLRDRDRRGLGLFEYDQSPLDGHAAINEMVSRPGRFYNSGGGGGSLEQRAPVSQDGLQVAFASIGNDVSLEDRNDFCLNLNGTTSCSDVFVFDQFRLDGDPDASPTEIASVSSNGEQGNNQSHTPAMSAGGRFVAFLSAATNLVPGDTNGVTDAFVRDRVRGTTARLSITSDGREGDGPSFDRTLGISADGRYVAFGSIARNLAADDHNDFCDNDFDGQGGENCGDVFLHDRLTGFTRRISEGPGGAEGDGRSGSPAISADGSVVAFESSASALIEDDTNDLCDNDFDGRAEENCQDVFIAHGDPLAGGDLDGDGDVDDTVLHVLDLNDPGAEPVPIAPARAVALAGGCAAFLAPEKEVGAGTDLNGDGDTDDHVVQLYCHGTGSGRVQNLGLAAVSVGLSRQVIAAIAPSPDFQPHPNQDGGLQLGVLNVARIGNPTAWTDTGAQAQALSVSGPFVAFLARHRVDLPRPAEISVVRLYDAAAAKMVVLEEPAEEFVLGDRLLAFRRSEQGMGAVDLNGDGDTIDAVLQVYDLASGELINTGQAAVPCNFASCDPRAPYRVFGDTVTFLTFEGDQGEDLTGNGDQDQLVLQTFEISLMGRPAFVAGARAAQVAGSSAVGSALTVVAAVSAGICTDSGHACATDAQCGAGAACHLPPGQCVVALTERTCDPDAPGNPCAPDAFCVTDGEPGKGTCHAAIGPCEHDSDCESPARCFEGKGDIRRLLSPLSFQPDESGARVVVTAGRCVEDLGVACNAGADSGCGAGESCELGTSGNGTCHRRHGTCRNDSDCPPSAACRQKIVVSGAADSDADGLADPFDNCPYVANAEQEDADGDGLGDACALLASEPTPTQTTALASPTPTVRRGGGGGCAAVPPGRSGDGLLMLSVALLWSLRVGKRRRDLWR